MLKKELIILLFVFPVVSLSQFRGQEPRPPSVVENPGSASAGSLFGFFDPARFSMTHAVSLSYMSVGHESIGVSAYTNSLVYRVSDPLTVRADVSMMYSPFGSLSAKLNNSFSGVFLERAQVDFRPSKDLGISLQFRRQPSIGNPWYGRFGSPYQSGTLVDEDY